MASAISIPQREEQRQSLDLLKLTRAIQETKTMEHHGTQTKVLRWGIPPTLEHTRPQPQDLRPFSDLPSSADLDIEGRGNDPVIAPGTCRPL